MKNNPPVLLPEELVELGNQRWQELQSKEQFSPRFENFEAQIKTVFSLSDFIFEQYLITYNIFSPLYFCSTQYLSLGFSCCCCVCSVCLCSCLQW
jgi:hypothetical protein